MRTALGTVALKSGETLDVSCVLGPEPAEAPRVGPFLGHKGEPWRWHIEKALREPLDDLETRFYIGEIDGDLVANICTFECGGVGILGHVFTTPAHRHKGVAGGVMGLQMEDFRRRGGEALTLGTGYGSNAYRIYAGYGFESAVPGSGDMKYAVEPGHFDRVMDPGPVAARPANWGDWGRLNLLFMRVDEGGLPSEDRKPIQEIEDRIAELTRYGREHGVDAGAEVADLRSLVRELERNMLARFPADDLRKDSFLRNMAYSWFGLTNVEGAYIQLQRDRESGKLHGAWILEKPGRIPVGFATVTTAPQWRGPVYQLDLYVHPRFEDSAPVLLESIRWPEGTIHAYTEADHRPLLSALADAGFREAGHLERHPLTSHERRDLILWTR